MRYYGGKVGTGSVIHLAQSKSGTKTLCGPTGKGKQEWKAGQKKRKLTATEWDRLHEGEVCDACLLVAASARRRRR